MPIFVFRELRAYDSEVYHSTPNRHKCAVRRLFMELLWILLCQIATILFVDTAR
jgi:hypothetical protein